MASCGVLASALATKRLPEKNSPSLTDDDRYYFGIDIGPSWYAPLGRIFALSQDDVERDALSVVRNDFGYDGEGRWDEDERSRRNLYEESQTYHSHGSHPRADNLTFYQAYHAMMIVAGKLLKTTPTHSDLNSDSDEFADWLDQHSLSRKDGRWLWDRRDPEPLERPSWLNLAEDSSRPETTPEDFQEALHSGSMVNVWGYWIGGNFKWEQSVYIRSALVSPDRSQALLRALATAKDVHDYALPGGDDNFEIDEAGYTLKGWIVDHSRDRGFDGQDRWAGDVRFPPPMPTPAILEKMGLKTDSDSRYWKDGHNSTVMTSELWGRYDERKRHESADPEYGNRLQASPSYLTEMAVKLGMDLIFKIQIDRRRRRRSYDRREDDDEPNPTKAKLFLLGSDGKFRTL